MNDKIIILKKNLNEDCNFSKITIRQTKIRNSNIELLRFILSIIVVCWHIPFFNHFWINPLMVTPVNVFAIITGYFLIKNNDDFRFFKFIPTVFCLYIFNILLNLIIGFSFDFANKINWKEVFFYGNAAWWYLWGILFIYLLSPILNLGIKLVNKYILLFITVSLWAIFQINGYIPQTYQISTYYFGSFMILLYCYFLGSFLQLHCQNYLQQIKKVRIVSIIILIFGFIFNTLYLVLKGHNSLLYLTYDNNSLYTLPLAFAVFTFFITLKIKNSEFINFLGRLSILIFAFHIFFVQNLVYIISTNNTGFTLIFALSFALILYLPFNYLTKLITNYSLWKKIKIYIFKNNK